MRVTHLVPAAALRLAVCVAGVDECAVAWLLVGVGAGHDRLEVSDVLVHLRHLRGGARLRVAGAGSPARSGGADAVFSVCLVGEACIQLRGVDAAGLPSVER